MQKLSNKYIVLGGSLILIGFIIANQSVRFLFTPSFALAMMMQIVGFVIMNMGGFTLLLVLISQLSGRPVKKVHPEPIRKICRVCGVKATHRYAGSVYYCDVHRPEQAKPLETPPDVGVKLCPRCQSSCTGDAIYCWNCQYTFSDK